MPDPATLAPYLTWQEIFESVPHRTYDILDLEALQSIAAHLNELFEPETIREWEWKPNPALGGVSPNSYMTKDDAPRRLLAILARVGKP